LYASILIPKISGLEEYSPSLILVSPTNIQNDTSSQKIQLNAEKFLYEGDFPSVEFYEPFGQGTYWERQELEHIFM